MIKKVSTVVLESKEGRGKILLLKRSDQVRSCRGLWACVSGTVEKDETPFHCAFRELKEETQLSEPKIIYIRSGRPFKVQIPNGPIVTIHPFLLRAALPRSELDIQIDFEHSEFHFSENAHKELKELPTVPRLSETFARVDLDPETEIALNDRIKGNLIDGANKIAQIAVKEFSLSVSRASKETTASVFINYLECVKSLAFHFATIRQSMSSISNAISRVVDLVSSSFSVTQSWDEVQNSVRNASEIIIKQMIDSSNIIPNLWIDSVLKTKAEATTKLTVITLSRSGTISQALLNHKFLSVNSPHQVFISESRIANEGVDFAKFLDSKTTTSSLNITIVPDCSLFSLIDSLIHDPTVLKPLLIIVGADSIFGDGSFVNKTGTRILALIARQYQQNQIRFCVLADTSKIRPEKAPSCDFPLVSEINTNSPEVFGSNCVNIHSWCPVFELIPFNSIPFHVEYFTEFGSLPLSELSSLSEKSMKLLSSILDPSD